MSEKLTSLDSLKLRAYLFAEGIIKDRQAGISDPWPTRARRGSAVLATVGFLSILSTFGTDVERVLRPSMDPCAPFPAPIYDTRRVTGVFEPSLAKAAPYIGGGGWTTLTGHRTMATGDNVGFYSETDLEIQMDPNIIRSVLNRETVGMDIPSNVQLIYLLANASFPNTEYGKNFTMSSVNPVVEAVLPTLRNQGSAPTSGIYTFGVIPLYDVFNRTILNHPNMYSVDQFRTAFSFEIMSEIRLTTASLLMEKGFTRAMPEFNDNVRNQMNMGGLRVNQISYGFLQRACQEKVVREG